MQTLPKALLQGHFSLIQLDLTVESCPRAQLVYVSLVLCVNNASEASKLQRVSSKKGLQRYMDAFTPHYVTDLPIGR